MKCIFVGVGPVSEGDVQLAAASGGKVVAFNTKVAGAAVEAEAKSTGVEVSGTEPLLLRLPFQLASNVFSHP